MRGDCIDWRNAFIGMQRLAGADITNIRHLQNVEPAM